MTFWEQEGAPFWFDCFIIENVQLYWNWMLLVTSYALPTMDAFLFHVHLFPSRDQLVHHSHLPFTSKCRVKRRRTAVSVSGLSEECCPLECIWCQRRTQAWGSGWGNSSIPDAGSLPFYSRDLQSRVSGVWIPRDSGCWMTKYACV